jgi:zinc transport system ATP-binding protein
MTHSLVSADRVSVTRKRRAILDDVSLSVSPGEFITIVGPNGAGKTVLLQVMMGLIRPDKGHVTRHPDLKIGFMPQRFTPEHTMPITVTRFLKLAKGASLADIRDSLVLVQAEALAERPLHVLSGGELQRVLLARALIHKPDLLVLDEPAQNLDIGGEMAFYRLLEDIYLSTGCGVLMVSHDLHMVMASTGKVVCLYHHICCSGAPDTVTQHPEFTALFGQDMTRMMSVYQHSHSHSHADGEVCAHDH